MNLYKILIARTLKDKKLYIISVVFVAFLFLLGMVIPRGAEHIQDLLLHTKTVLDTGVISIVLMVFQIIIGIAIFSNVFKDDINTNSETTIINNVKSRNKVFLQRNFAFATSLLIFMIILNTLVFFVYVSPGLLNRYSSAWLIVKNTLWYILGRSFGSLFIVYLVSMTAGMITLRLSAITMSIISFITMMGFIVISQLFQGIYHNETEYINGGSHIEGSFTQKELVANINEDEDGFVDKDTLINEIEELYEFAIYDDLNNLVIERKISESLNLLVYKGESSINPIKQISFAPSILSSGAFEDLFDENDMHLFYLHNETLFTAKSRDKDESDFSNADKPLDKIVELGKLFGSTYARAEVLSQEINETLLTYPTSDSATRVLIDSFISRLDNPATMFTGNTYLEQYMDSNPIMDPNTPFESSWISHEGREYTLSQDDLELFRDMMAVIEYDIDAIYIPAPKDVANGSLTFIELFGMLFVVISITHINYTRMDIK